MRFHVEQFKILSTLITRSLPVSKEQADKLTSYALLIHTENQKYNLTGHKTPEEIIDNLIIGSIAPVIKLNVPRGTYFADLGTGAGIPGIPLAVFIEKSRGILFDSNSKKIKFIENASKECGIKNIKGISCRIEEEGRNDKYRGTFDWVFSRAMADIYIACELGAPLLKKGGHLFLFSRGMELVEKQRVQQHVSSLGLEIIQERKNENKSMMDEGILFRMTGECPSLFPRRMAAIRRDREKIV